MSHAHSTASSTRHILQPEPLEPPSAPFASVSSSSGHSSPKGSYRSLTPLASSEASGPVSLSVNYLPHKFSGPLPGGIHRRKTGKGGDVGGGPVIPKRGGGREAFRSGEARMPGEGDEDYDGVTSGWFGGKAGGKAKPRLRWNRFKWILFSMNLCLTVYSLVALIFCLLTWFNVWTHADIIRVANHPELIISTFAASAGIITALVGWSGILLNNRSFLAIYTLLLWVCFALLVAPGYITYKRKTFNLEGKLNAQWSRNLGVDGRLRVQNQLQCCGYFSPFVEATVSQTCYARSTLPGCKNGFLKFERKSLTRWYAAAFLLVPLHIAVIVAALMCSNHVTYRFGKGMMPKAYRLSMNSMAVIMDQYANQLAEQYGSDVASELLARSRSNLNLQIDGMPSYTNANANPSTLSPSTLSPSNQNQYTSVNTNNNQFASINSTTMSTMPTMPYTSNTSSAASTPSPFGGPGGGYGSLPRRGSGGGGGGGGSGSGGGSPDEYPKRI
ncbi:hypothetical protein BD410DRAFT_549786 [Rickenella mellea]|uniref:Tetraspanin Tsp2 n=1 Tax=Rickenella mellea TaxID=50990 RepID=A0A4Y7PPY2_9AGAM|nr:hypothetical protein BD410DRAFT_549786 [Rickenella mellea]